MIRLFYVSEVNKELSREDVIKLKGILLEMGDRNKSESCKVSVVKCIDSTKYFLIVSGVSLFENPLQRIQDSPYTQERVKREIRGLVISKGVQQEQNEGFVYPHESRAVALYTMQLRKCLNGVAGDHESLTKRYELLYNECELICNVFVYQETIVQECSEGEDSKNDSMEVSSSKKLDQGFYNRWDFFDPLPEAVTDKQGQSFVLVFTLRACHGGNTLTGENEKELARTVWDVLRKVHCASFINMAIFKKEESGSFMVCMKGCNKRVISDRRYMKNIRDMYALQMETMCLILKYVQAEGWLQEKPFDEAELASLIERLNRVSQEGRKDGKLILMDGVAKQFASESTNRQHSVQGKETNEEQTLLGKRKRVLPESMKLASKGQRFLLKLNRPVLVDDKDIQVLGRYIFQNSQVDILKVMRIEEKTKHGVVYHEWYLYVENNKKESGLINVYNFKNQSYKPCRCLVDIKMEVQKQLTQLECDRILEEKGEKMEIMYNSSEDLLVKVYQDELVQILQTKIEKINGKMEKKASDCNGLTA